MLRSLTVFVALSIPVIEPRLFPYVSLDTKDMTLRNMN
jgi:hypothetical protein